MQPNNSLVKSMGSLGGNKVAMKFDENSIEHIMSVLTDLYSDPIAAVVREYSTNALDSHKAVGQTRPVEVTLPTQFDPNFRVRDFGLGLSVDDVTNIYSQYGASTKRGTNDQTGMLGLGCKSGLTYADQFIVNAVKGGVHVSVVVSRTETGAGVMEILDTLVTDEPNGVEIVIPTRIGDYNEFRNTVNTFFAYWPEGSVLVNGEAPARFDSGGDSVIKLSDSLYVVRGQSDHKIVMGDVAYPVDDFDKFGIKAANQPSRWSGAGAWAIVAYVEMGSVNFTPSREDLHMTRLTNATLAKIGEDFDRHILDKVNEDIATAENHAAAWKKFQIWSNLLGLKNLKPVYKGVEVPESIKIEGILVSPGRRGSIHHDAGRVAYDRSKSLFVTGLANTSTTQRKSILTWIEQKGYSFRDFYLVDEPMTSPFFADSINVDWETVKAETRKTRTAEYRRTAGTYPIAMPNSNWTGDYIMPDSDKIVWMRRTDAEYHSISLIKQALGQDFHVVVLNENRVNKFRRDFPEVLRYTEAIQDALEGTVGPKNKHDRMRDKVEEAYLARIAAWDASLINDPKIKTLIADCKAALASTWNKKYASKVSVASRFGINLLENESDGACATPMETLAGYPFLALDFKGYGYNKNIHNVPAEHIYDYLNMVYEGTE